MINLVFKVIKAEDGSFRYSMFEGRLAQGIGLTTKNVKGRTPEEVFGSDGSLFYKDKYSLGFSGEVVSYKHYYQGRTFYTTLSPAGISGNVEELIGSAVDITTYEEATSKIEHMASHDPLTDLPNRMKLHSDLSVIIESFSSFTVIFCNLDRFKYVNDAFGHFAGDQVIQMMAERLSSLTPESGRLYRVGGDEFIITLCGDYSPREVRTHGDQIIRKLSLPIHSFGKQFFITGSIGVAQYPSDASKSTDLIMCADVALQYSKMNGRQLLSFYKPEMNRDYNQLLSLEGDLREAISKNQLSLYYQPKVDVRTGYISGMEALVRWKHPEKGMISPGEFIPIAEETGVITQLDDWVLREACKQSQVWIDRGYAPERIAVNVSAREIQRRDYAEKVRNILSETLLDPRYLEIEVTEDSVMQNTEQCIRTMQDLRALGVSLSIDDFGTGYSSLSYLREFPIHYLKIDQAFIKGVLTEPSDAEIVKAMIQLADAFQIEVVAEGVEREEVLGFLRENECSYYQGYHFSKPVPAEEMESYLSKKEKYQ
ncbi:diguanylate cyclase (GGDEF) domain-containing protein [Halobacillus dabanensis]|uniref:Diguanylate cyclase (GGDEF) domain-containing protein n=1 Tax=Halobacillus dabanensis TaxID=240302 RepID=A0A1I3XNY4_HALDA|nr:diguanylate cyclase (GGDEF) domain-containing protein [Halobacillus dabanensis]